MRLRADILFLVPQNTSDNNTEYLVRFSQTILLFGQTLIHFFRSVA